MSTFGDILKEGYLVKAPDASRNLHAFKKWQRKWFRLHQNGDLFYYDNEKASKAIGVIHLLQCYRAFDGRTKGLQLSYCVGLEISGDNYYLKAESASTFNDWVRLLSKFAEVSEVSLASPSGSPGPERRGTVGPEDAVVEGILRTGSTASTLSVQSRHFSVATRSRFVKKEGWLAKTGGTNKGWKDRYFVLSNGRLNYFKNEKTDSSQGTIDLFECTNVSKGSGKKGYGFEIEVPGRTFNISAENEHIQSEWIAAIRQTMGVIAEIKSHTQLQEPMQIPRSGSGSSTFSDTSLGSRDLQESTVSTSSTLTTSAIAVQERHGTPDGSSSSATSGPRREEKDSVIQLLEAEVEALRTKVSSLESALASSTVATSQLQDQLAESRGQQEGELRHLREEKDNFIAQVLQLERSKSELEAVNDSLQTQLEEHSARIQELEEEGMGLRHELEEVQGSVAASEEELTETQQRLQEIEGIAKDLEAALIRKGEDPQTPLLERRRSFTRSLSSTRIETKLEQVSGSTESSLTKSTTTTGTSELQQLQQQLEVVEQERNDLQEELNTMKEAQKSVPKASSEEEIRKEAAVLLEEGRLKWQMETENMRKEYEAKLEKERQTFTEEKSSQEAALSLAEEKYSNLQESCQQQKIEFEKSLTDAQERIHSLESEVSSFQERVGQLQVEKEKAVADLIAIRKINRTMEKKISEGEVDARPPSVNSFSERVESPDVQQRLLEAEKKVEELQALLQEVQLERDQLKSQLEKLLSDTSNGFPESDRPLGDMSRFGFRTKSRATIAASAKAPSDPIHSHRTKSFSGVVRPLQMASENRDNPPPKPKRPPKELMSKFQAPAPVQQQQDKTRPRAATMLLRTLFPQR